MDHPPVVHHRCGDVEAPGQLIMGSDLTQSRPSRLGRLIRPFRRTPLEERLRITAASAVLRAFADDDGTLEVRVAIANLSRRGLTIERFHCEQWLWNGAVLPSAEPHVRGIGTRVPGYGFTDFWLTFQLGAGALRRIHGATPPAQNPFSSVEARIEILGRLWFARRRTPIWLHLTPPNAELTTPWTEPLAQRDYQRLKG